MSESSSFTSIYNAYASSPSSQLSQKRPAASIDLSQPPAAQQPRHTQPTVQQGQEEDEAMDGELAEWQQDALEGKADVESPREPASFLGVPLASRMSEAVDVAVKDYQRLVKALSSAEAAVGTLDRIMGTGNSPRSLPAAFNALLKVPEPHYSELLTPAEIAKGLEDEFRKDLRVVVERGALRYRELRRTELGTARGRLSESSFFPSFHSTLKESLKKQQERSGVAWSLYHRALRYATASLFQRVQLERIAAAEAATEKELELSRKAAKVDAAREGAALSTPGQQQETVAELIDKQMKKVRDEMRADLAAFVKASSLSSSKPTPSSSSTPSSKKKKKGKGGKTPSGATGSSSGGSSSGGPSKKGTAETPTGGKKGGAGSKKGK